MSPIKRFAQQWMGMYLAMCVTGVFLFGCSVFSVRLRAPENPMLADLEPKAGLIAYQGVDGNIYTMDQGGGNLTQITSDADMRGESGAIRLYQHLTWAPDSDKLAFVRLQAAGTEAGAAVMVSGPKDAAPIEAFSSADELPFYLYWAPDSETVGFLTSSDRSPTFNLRTASTAAAIESQIVGTGAPYYWHWSPDGSRLVAHIGGVSPFGKVQVISSAGRDETVLDVAPGLFRAPAWSPDGVRLLLAVENDAGKQELVIVGPQGEPQQTIAPVDHLVAFNWSPDGKRLAYVPSERPDWLAGPLVVVDPERPEDPIIIDGQIAAYFWSPDSRKIAYFAPAAQGEVAQVAWVENQLVLQLFVLDVRTGKAKSVFQFRPTPDFLQLLPHFDQYGHSATIWSPDSDNLVLPGLYGEGQSGIFMLAASGQLDPLYLADGVLAFWSWK